MRIAVLSDTHDQIGNLRSAVRLLNEEGIGLLIHCGDLISAFMLEELARFRGKAHLVYGNNAGDRRQIEAFCGTRFPAIRHHGAKGTLTVGGRRIAFLHYPAEAADVAESGGYDLVCCGHNHRYEVRWVNECMILNPGEMLGKELAPGFCILDLETLAVRRLVVGQPFSPA